MNVCATVVCLFAGIGAAQTTSGSEWDRLMLAGWKAFQGAEYAEAERFYAAALRLAEAGGARDIRVARSLSHYGCARSSKGDCEGGVRVGVQAVRVYEALADAAPDEVGHAWLNLGRSYYCRGLFANAEHAFRKALPLEEGAARPEKEEIAEILTALAAVYQIRHNVPAAMEAAGRAAAMLREIPEGDPHARALLLNNLGAIYNRSGRPAEAEKALREGLLAARAIRRDRDVSEFYVLTNLGITVYEQGRYGDADAQFAGALEILNRGAALPDFEIEKFLRSYAKCLNKLGRKGDARGITARVDALRRQNGGPDEREWTVGVADLRRK